MGQSGTARVKIMPVKENVIEAGRTYLIRFKPQYADKGFGVLLTSSGQIGALPKETYVVGVEHIALLNKARIPYEILQQ